jgi:hypothetical protein
MVSGIGSYPLGALLESVFLFRVSVDRNLPVFFESSHITVDLNHAACAIEGFKIYEFIGFRKRSKASSPINL